MTDKDAAELDGSNLGDSGLEEHITHWAEVLDRWVRGIDMRLGRLSNLDGLPQEVSDELDGGPGAEN